ncbi:RRM domain-containing protein [Pseudozyma hubeiensis]|nr:RRM domain-containing protein [Pseudozyma hubeiensis]
MSSSTIYVGNIPPSLDESSLSTYFAPFGDIISISVPATTTPLGRRNKGFGFITFSHPDEALDAIDNMNLNAIKGRTIQVNLTDASKVKEPSKGRAVWDDEAWLKQHASEATEPETGDVPGTT